MTLATRLVCLIFVLVLVTGTAFAQGVATADLRGTITDPQGAVVSNATVTVRDKSRNFERSTTTDSDGEYLMLALPPGSYEVEVDAQGFGKLVTSGVNLTVGQAADLSIELKVAGQTQTVEVEGTPELVETQRSAAGTTINQQRIDNLPINGRTVSISLISNSCPPSRSAYYTNELFSTIGVGGNSNAGVELWNVSYSYIFKCNQAIIGITNSNSISPTTRNQLIGEAKFLRAFLYFYLVNLYGDVPLVSGVDPNINRSLPRIPKLDVYNYIINDLIEAKSLLSADFLESNLKSITAERVRPTTWAATALLARTYLYVGEFGKAEAEATTVINHTALFDLPGVPLEDVFLKNSNEAIWQIQPGTIGQNTIDANWSVLIDAPEGFNIPKSVFLSKSLYNDFEPGDARKDKWIGTYLTSPVDSFNFPYKYKKAEYDPSITDVWVITEYQMVLRLAEQYLIRAEAKAMQGKLSEAITDINVLRTRARATSTTEVPDPLPDISSALSQEEIIAAIGHERKVELFAEWGHRWFDLKRTSKLNEIMTVVSTIKGGVWQSTDAYYPIPITDIQQNPNLTQNPGY